MPHPYFSHGALAISLLPGLIGVRIFLSPLEAMRTIEFPVPTDPANAKLVSSIMRIYAVRNMAVSFLLALLYRNGSPRVHGLGLCAGFVMALADGLVSRDLTGGGEQYHWPFLPIIGGTVAGLFGWFG